MHAPVPPVEIADYADATRVGCPDRKVHACPNAVDHRPRAQSIECAHVRALAKQMLIELGEHRPIAIRVVDFDFGTVAPRDPQLIIKRLPRDPRHKRFEHAFGVQARHGYQTAIGQAVHRNRRSVRPKCSDGHASFALLFRVVRAENGKRIRVQPAREKLD
jgi:hypothetical protein